MDEIAVAGPSPCIRMTIENTGATPANHLSVRWAWRVTADVPDSNFFDEHLEPYRVHYGENCIGPAQSKTIPLEIEIHSQWRSQVLSGAMRFYFLGEITYRDAFEHERKTEFLYVYNPKLPNRLGQASVRNNIL